MSVQVGDIIDGKVSDIMNYGVFIKLDDGKSGLVHISEVSKEYVEDIHAVLNVGDTVKVKVLTIDEKGKMALSIKKALPIPEKNRERARTFENSAVQNNEHLSLDDMLTKFLKDSDEKQLYLKRNIDSKRGYSKRH